MAEEEEKKKKRRTRTIKRFQFDDVRLRKKSISYFFERPSEIAPPYFYARRHIRKEIKYDEDCKQKGVLKRLRILSTPSSHILYLLCLLPFLLSFNPLPVTAEGNVGCVYVSSLCIEGLEFCYDDLVFGKCLSKAGVEMEDIDRTPLTEGQSRVLATMLEELQGAGLGWDHPFVQCRVQGTLFAMRRRTQLPPNLCANLAPDPEILGPQSPSAFVRFTPPENEEEFAEEIYYPPLKKEYVYTNLRPPSPARIRHVENLKLLAELEHQPEEERQRIIQENLGKKELINHLKDIEHRLELQKMLAEYNRGVLKPPIYVNNDIYLDPSEILEEPNDDDFDDSIDNNKRSEQHEIPSTFFRELARDHNIPFNLDYDFSAPPPPKHTEHKFDFMKSKPLIQDGLGNYYDYETKRFLPKKKMEAHRRIPDNGVFTEGGSFVPSERESDEEIRKEEARTLLADMLGFTRHERLDVKKPGPLLGPSVNKEKNNVTILNELMNQKPENKEILPTHIKSESIKKAKKLSTREHSSEDHAQYSVDTEYAYVIMKHPIDSWAEGVRIVNALANSLQMNFTHPRIDSHEVSFRVEPNPDKKSAADVAKSINADRFKSNIFRRFGVTVIKAGVGNKVKYDAPDVQTSKMEYSEEGPDVTHIMAYMFAGAGAAAAIVIVVVLFLIRRHDKKRDKLGGLQGGTSGNESCSKDYQELCRARMAAKGQPQDSPGSGRITALTKENERPPSSRSSTSSWSEEPALTNMDISTGHMVLSYMEDHLRNKGRLQREWEALCRYEAEPSAREAALQEECQALNRPTAPLPYDHSRVVLNHLANAEGLDYINASTITDHDPRAPAYVAAQGPLPTTLAHFWQMIWEQGAVVIVSLCRLQENGESVCARYWPEEGAEVYHIYEVHLVSEHIWCDDYLVRSFYLKNLRTSETRTVTQFHFLSWPQNGVPTQAKALLEFRRKVNKSYRGRSCPIVVHSSNGAGRTGAYILLDLVLGRMNKGAREIDIAATLEHLRDQRAGLVATRQQFEFVLMAVAEEVHAILKALPANQTEKRDLDKDVVKEEDEITQTKQQEKTKTDKKDETTKEQQSSSSPQATSSTSTATAKASSSKTSTPKKEEK